MPEILCPHCGKPNPEGQEFCLHCQTPLKTQPAAVPPGGDELPDWLRDLQASEPTFPAEPTPTEDAAPAEAELPDWLRQVLPPAEATQPEETPVEPVAAEETPAWLDNLLATPQQSEASDEVIPDWLADLTATKQPDIPLQEHTGPEGVQEAATPQPAPSPVEPPASAAQGAETTREQPAPPPEETSLPDWLINLQESAAEKPSAGVPAFTFDEEQPPQETPAAEDHLLTTLPDWVSQLTAEQPEEPATEPESGLTPAELPGWVEAMRPTESASPTAPLEDLSTAETVASGPLIGLRGVLSAEPDAIRARKPATHALKLRITDDQRARLALLEELLAGEQKPKPLPQKTRVSPLYLFRLIIALALLLPILWVTITQSNIASLPAGEDYPTVLQFDSAIRLLNQGDPVLVAVDYEAGFIGELDHPANVLLSRVIEQGAYPVLVSTTPAGPVLSQRLLTHLADTRDPNYMGAINLGYLPGGAMGMASLIQSPRQVLPFTLNDLDPWSAPPLNAVNTLADFGMVVVITHDADMARAWIEQTGTTLQTSNVPLLMIVSTQAEPLVRPYASGETPLVKALLAGLTDTAAYENMTTRYSPGRHATWDALSLTLPIAALVIIIGTLAGAVLTAIKEGQEEAKNKPKPRRKTPRKQERP